MVRSRRPRLFGGPRLFGACSRLLALLSLHLPQGRTVPLAASSPYLVRQVVRAAVSGHAAGFLGAGSGDSGPARRLDPSTISEMRHNGTHMERNIHAKWQCTFPNGDCFKNHAPMEGLPEKMDTCTEEKTLSALEVQMTIDLTCANMNLGMDCKKGVNKKPFDPFLLCNADPNLLKATCQLECRTKKAWNNEYRPFETCVFKFDTAGVFNMSDKTIETCGLEATCKSPYVEQNEMFCSGKKTTGKHQAHWLTEENPWKHRETHGIQAPPVQAGEEVNAGMDWVPNTLPRRHRTGAIANSVLLVVGVFLFLVAGWIHFGRQDCLPGPLQQVYEELNERFHRVFNFTAQPIPQVQSRAAPAAYKGPGQRYAAPQVPHDKMPDDEALEFSAAS